MCRRRRGEGDQKRAAGEKFNAGRFAGEDKWKTGQGRAEGLHARSGTGSGGNGPPEGANFQLASEVVDGDLAGENLRFMEA